jgi:predicted lipid-binding transport protein (Tim44 family)
VQYAGLGQESVASPPLSQPVGGSAAASLGGSGAEAFLKGAKANFLKLQLANEARQWDDIREFTTDEMFAALREDAAAGGEQTEVMSLSAELVDVATEGDKHWASVRFSGLVREARGAEPAAFAEVWNLVKPADGSSGWLLAGIQQVH